MVEVNRGDRGVEGIGEQELAEYLFEHNEDDSVWRATVYELESGERVGATVFQMRILAEEMDEIAKAALADGGNVSEFVRTAALEKARATSGKTRAPSADELQQRLDRALELVEQLHAELAPAAPKRRKAPAA